jgi:hypothetical protein
MWLPREIIKTVDDVARIYYIDAKATKMWNAHKREGELRMLTGWCWVARAGDEHRQGFKTPTVCYRDAWYSLVAHRAAPAARRLRLVRAA